LSLALKKHKGDTKKMSMNIVRNNQVSRCTTKIGFNDKTSRQFHLYKNWMTKDSKSFHYLETNQCCDLSIKLPNSMKIHHVFHISLLESYHASTILGKICEPPPPIKIDGEQEYEMEDVLDS
jgi:hypothetical protein